MPYENETNLELKVLHMGQQADRHMDACRERWMQATVCLSPAFASVLMAGDHDPTRMLLITGIPGLAAASVCAVRAFREAAQGKRLEEAASILWGSVPHP